ncbi:MAG: molybdenum cofactor biosynthesis protein B [Myxococcota bacterium]
MSAPRGVPDEHRDGAPRSLAVFVLTVSDTRALDSDRSGKQITEALEANGHRVQVRELVRDEPDAIARAALQALLRPDIDVLIATGGTGVAPRDVTPDAIEPLLDRTLPGFGELFRALSFEEIGPAAMLSRALAGVSRGTAVFVLPGSSGAVRLALERLLLPELPHLIRLLRGA